MNKHIIIRCAGIVLNSQKEVLLVNSIYDEKEYWILPGGGLEFSENLHECVKREIKEETNIEVEVKRLVYMDENLSANKHMIHFTFLCQAKNNKVKTGTDPDQEKKVIQEAKFVSIQDIQNLKNFIPPVMKEYLIEHVQHGFPDQIINFSHNNTF